MRKTLTAIKIGAVVVLACAGLLGRATVYGVGLLMDVKVALDAEDRADVEKIDELRENVTKTKAEEQDATEKGEALYHAYEAAKARYTAAEAAATKARHRLQRAERMAARMEAEEASRLAAEREAQREISDQEKMAHIVLKSLGRSILVFLALILIVQIRAYILGLPLLRVWGRFRI